MKFQSANRARFELVFSDGTPFTSSCDKKSNPHGKLACAIGRRAESKDYLYDVVIESCPDQQFDPRIVVR